MTIAPTEGAVRTDDAPEFHAVRLVVNGEEREADIDTRASLLDLVRGSLELTGTKWGCNQGACGACTVLLDGQRVLSCLTLAVQCEGCEVTTIEGVHDTADGAHPLQLAFIEHDGFQCGYCTPGQVCSGIGMADEVARGVPSAVSGDVSAEHIEMSATEIRERMSGNLCRCGAHNGIVKALSVTYSDGRPR